MPMALEGVKVIEMGTFGPANLTACHLGDMGADVVMVESPVNRNMPPGSGYAEGGHTRAIFSRNKKSIVLDLRKNEARDILHKLAKGTDVFIEANRPGVAKRLGFDYQTLSAINPRIICASLTGYGQTGPYKDLPGHGNVWEGIGGWLRTQGQNWGNMGGDYTGRPYINWYHLADLKAVYTTFASILMALYQRDKIGTGQYLDLAIFDTVITVRDQEVPQEGDGAFATGDIAENVYECKDGGWIATNAGEVVQWANFCKALGVPELTKERGAQGQRAQEIIQTFNRIFKTRTRDEWFEDLRKIDTEAVKCNTLDEVPQDPQVKVRGMHVEVVGDGGHKQVQYGIPFKLSKTPGRSYFHRAPKFGEHTGQIMAELGYKQEDIVQLKRAGAVI